MINIQHFFYSPRPQLHFIIIITYKRGLIKSLLSQMLYYKQKKISLIYLFYIYIIWVPPYKVNIHYT